jgi:hypothetical protein
MINALIPHIVGVAMRAYPAIIPRLSKETWAVFRAAGGFDGIRNTYWAIIYDAVHDYLTGDKPVTTFKNAMKKGMVDAFVQAAELGYEDAGGELPMDDDTLAWLGDAQSAELGHIDDLFSRLKAEWDGIDPISEAFARADGYAATLDSIYGQAKLRGSENVLLEFGGEDGDESCETCQDLKGKKALKQYILDNNLIPSPGNEAFECKGYHCAHFWFNPKTGEEFRG